MYVASMGNKKRVHNFSRDIRREEATYEK